MTPGASAEDSTVDNIEDESRIGEGDMAVGLRGININNGPVEG